LFRRTEKSEAPAAEPKEGGKGRPTPSRKEAEAAAKERARAAMDKDTAKKLLRERRTEDNRKMREGMKTGDERFLPARDQGPVKRFVRDWVDSRLTFTEFLLPVLVLIMVLSVLGSKNSSSGPAVIANYLWSASVLLLLVDVVYTRFRLRKALKTRFPEENLRGTTFYAFIRLLQLRPMRMPKPQVKVGGQPR
jgi:hypothetical protein